MLLQCQKHWSNSVVNQSGCNPLFSQGGDLKKAVLQLSSKYFRKLFSVKF